MVFLPSSEGTRLPGEPAASQSQSVKVRKQALIHSRLVCFISGPVVKIREKRGLLRDFSCLVSQTTAISMSRLFAAWVAPTSETRIYAWSILDFFLMLHQWYESFRWFLKDELSARACWYVESLAEGRLLWVEVGVECPLIVGKLSLTKEFFAHSAFLESVLKYTLLPPLAVSWGYNLASSC